MPAERRGPRNIPIAERVLRLASSRRSVHAFVYAPQRSATTSNDEWECMYEVTGLPEAIQESAHGLDSLQALLCAIQALSRDLETFRKDLKWFDAGDLGDSPHSWIS